MSDASRADAMARLDRLTKPVGALGRLEALAAQLADIADCCPPPMPAPAAVAVFAGDHGVWSEGVSPWPQAVTAQMVANFTAGGAAINVIARQVGASVTVVDVGVATPCASAAGLIEANVRRGTRNLVCAAAMTDAECAQALAVGAEVAGNLISGGARLLVTGDMGIANTTPSAALIAAYTGSKASRSRGVEQASTTRLSLARPPSSNEPYRDSLTPIRRRRLRPFWPSSEGLKSLRSQVSFSPPRRVASLWSSTG